jgi:hypothetical protein
MRRYLVLGTGALVLVFILAAEGCTGGAKNAPSPAGQNVDVGRLFLKYVQSPTFSARFTADGAFRLGPMSLSISGGGEMRGQDLEDSYTVEAAGFRRVTADLTLQGIDYERIDDGPWVRQPPDTFTDPFMRLSSVQDVGSETKNGEQLNHLRPEAGFQLLPSDLGITPSDVSDFVGTLDFFARADGSPALMVISTSWTQKEGQLVGSITYRFSDIGAQVALSPPSQIWNVFDSKRFEYRIAYPPDWDATSSTNEKIPDVLTGPGTSGTQAAVQVASTRIPASWANHSFNRWVIDAMITNLHTLGTDAENLPLVSVGIKPNAMIAGEPAEILRYHAKQQGHPVFYLDAEVVHLDRGYSIYWASTPGSESTDTVEFKRFLSTFQFGS